jgi:hypothetical protein
MRSDASPDLDGFSSGFLKHLLPVARDDLFFFFLRIRDDLMSIFEAFHAGDVHLDPVNQAHMVLNFRMAFDSVALDPIRGALDFLCNPFNKLPNILVILVGDLVVVYYK